MTDFVHTIGREHYSLAEFVQEAGKLGVSRRIGKLPDDLEVGKSRVFLAFEAGRDSAPRKCKTERCAALKVKLPPPVRATDGTVYTVCGSCNTVYHGKAHKFGRVTHYFVPDAIEVVVRCGPVAVRELAKTYVGLGVLDAKVEEGPELLRVACTITESTAEGVVAALKAAGAEVDAEVLGKLALRNGTKVMGVSGEPRRGCGYRSSNGSYVVANASGRTPLVELATPVAYTGSHFRGLRRLTPDESARLDTHLAGDAMVESLPFAVAA